MLTLLYKQISMATQFNYIEEIISHSHKRKVQQLLYLSSDFLVPHHFLYHKTEWEQRLLMS